jgi:hypothetical protein
MTATAIARHLVPVGQRLSVTAELWGNWFPLRIEPTIFHFARELAPAYTGGYWDMYTLSNGGFYMAPSGDGVYGVESPNGWSGPMTADALGIAACLFTYSNLAFSAPDLMAEVLSECYHWLRDWMLDGHPEARQMMACCD